MEVSRHLHARPLYPRGKSPRYPLYRCLDGPQNQSERYGVGKKFFPLPGIVPRPSSPWPVAVPNGEVCIKFGLTIWREESTLERETYRGMLLILIWTKPLTGTNWSRITSSSILLWTELWIFRWKKRTFFFQLSNFHIWRNEVPF
jgi:hypothetical protein